MTNRIDKIFDKYSDPEDRDLLIKKLDKVKLKNLGLDEEELWYSARGALEFRITNSYRSALPFFQEGAERFPQSNLLKLNYGLALEDCGEIEKAYACFSKLKIEDVSSQAILAIARIYYLWGYYSEGLEIIKPIFNAYYQLGIADDHFLSMRGLPFYGNSFGYKAVFSKLSKLPEIAKNELKKAKEELADYPFSFIENKLRAFLTGDWSGVLQDLTTREDDEILGIDATLKALIESREINNYKVAISILERVKVSEYDFPWLLDILTLGKAEAANRFNQREDEERFKQEFFDKQPRLFEPEHVFRFGLDNYQEILKKDYIKYKKDSLNTKE